MHVTLRALPGLPSFRSLEVFAEIERALGRASKEFFRVVQFSVQTDHLHLIVEADGTLALTRGTQGLAIRCARAINRAVRRRGRVWAHRYHAHYLRSPREVRAAYAYVLLNFRKHLRAAPGIDPRSSGRWFDGWARPPPATDARDQASVVPARTWLASLGWRRGGGPIDQGESPALRSKPVRRAPAQNRARAACARWRRRGGSLPRRRS